MSPLRLAAVAVLSIVAPLPARALTVAGGTIATDTTWSLADSPVLVTATPTVQAGATLTIAAGVQVVFSHSVGLTVNGVLLANGTAAAPVVFEPDAAASMQWSGITIGGTVAAPISGSVLNHVEIALSGRNGASGLSVSYADVTVQNSVIRDCAGHGIRGTAGGTVHVSDTAITGNGGYAISLDGPANPTLARLTLSGNVMGDGVALSYGILTGTHVWEKAATTMRYWLTGGIFVAAGAHLTIEPGVEVRSFGSCGLTVNGTLTAIGTAAAPITFVPADASAIKSWTGIQIVGTEVAPLTGSVLDHVVIDGAGRNGWPNLAVRYATVDVRNCQIVNGGGNGVELQFGGLAHLSGCTLADNGGYAIHVGDGGANPNLSALTIHGNGSGSANAWGGDGVAIALGTLAGAHVWENAANPMRYFILTGITVARGARLEIQPGVEVRFTPSAGLVVNGALSALGTAEQPILFTAADPGAAVAWDGVDVRGATGGPVVAVGLAVNAAVSALAAGATATANLDHVVIERGGGWTANLVVDTAAVQVTNSIIRDSRKDAVWARNATGTSISSTELVGVPDGYFGVRNTGGGQVLAANDWWGHPNGPTQGACNPAGSGTGISGDVIFDPFLAGTGIEVGPAAPTAVTTLELTPLRWFVPADGVTRLWVTATVRTGDGRPAPGRTVHLTSTLGTVTDGGVTDAEGQAFAYVVSSAQGEALLGGTISSGTCEGFRGGTASVVFTAPGSELALLPGAQAPYLSDGLEIAPMPVRQGVPSVVRATVTNPGATAITVNASLAIAQRGLGLQFGPLGSVTAVTIPAGASRVIEVPWSPPASGHYCIKFEYSATPLAAAAATAAGPGALAPAWAGSQQKNLDATPASLASEAEKDAIQRGKAATDAIDAAANVASVLVDGWNGVAGLVGGWIQGQMVGGILDFNFAAWRAAADALAGKETTGPSVPSWYGKGAPGNHTTPPKRRQIDLPWYPGSLTFLDHGRALAEAAIEVTLDFDAALVAQERYRMAVEAGSPYWAAKQASWLVYYKRQAGLHLVAFADALEATLADMKANGMVGLTLTEPAVQAYLDGLAAQGFSAEELEAAQVMGFTEADLAIVKSRRLGLAEVEEDPWLAHGLAGDYLHVLEQAVQEYRTAGTVLAGADNFGGSIAGQIPGGLAVEAATLVRVHETRSTFAVGNPLSATATIDLRVRPLDLPPDWVVTVSPASVTLDPGAAVTGVVTVTPGSAVAQGYVARIAVEGWSGGALIGGVVTDVHAPVYTPVAASCDASAGKVEGAACACDLECGGAGVCAGGICLAACGAGNTCAAGRTCAAFAPGVGACTPNETSSGGGCGCGQGEATGLGLLLLGAALLRRRRAPQAAA